MRSTRFMRRIYSAMDNDESDLLDQIKSDIDLSNDNDVVDTAQIKYIKMPEQITKVIDKDTGEVTLTKKSGNCIIMKSDDNDLNDDPLKINKKISDIGGMFNIPSKRSLESVENGNSDLDSITEIFSCRDIDYGTLQTKIFAVFGQRIDTDLDSKKIKELKDTNKELDEKINTLEDQIESKSNDASVDTHSEDNKAKHEGNVLKREQARLELLKAKREGNDALIHGNDKKISDALEKTAKANSELNEVDRDDSKVKEDINKDDSQVKMDTGNSYKGRTFSKKIITPVRRTFSIPCDSYFSNAGYDDEHTFIMGKLTELRGAPNKHSKDKLISDLKKTSEKLSDPKVKKILDPVISELSKLEISDDQYTDIIDDLIESMSTRTVTRTFGMGLNILDAAIPYIATTGVNNLLSLWKPGESGSTPSTTSSTSTPASGTTDSGTNEEVPLTAKLIEKVGKPLIQNALGNLIKTSWSKFRDRLQAKQAKKEEAQSNPVQNEPVIQKDLLLNQVVDDKKTSSRRGKNKSLVNNNLNLKQSDIESAIS